MAHRRIKAIVPLPLYYFILALYFIYLLSLPYLVAVFVPCLNHNPFVSYGFAECNTIRALDTFVTLALSGAAAWIIGLVVLNRGKAYGKQIVAASVFLAVAIVASYSSYIRQAQRSVDRAPITLESL